MSWASTDPQMPGADDRLVDRLLKGYEARHQSIANRIIQFVALPLMLWSGLALAKALPEPAILAAIPLVDWAFVAALLLSGGYALLSLRLGAAMAAFSLILLVIAAANSGKETLPLWQPAIVFLGLGTVLWLIGRRIEGRPRLLSEIALDLAMGPAWLLARVLNLLRIGY